MDDCATESTLSNTASGTSRSRQRRPRCLAQLHRHGSELGSSKRCSLRLPEHRVGRMG